MKRRDLRVVRGSDKIPFSLGAIVESLQGAGVATDEAISIARGVEKHARQLGLKTIELDNLVDRLTTTIAKQVDRTTARRFKKQTPPFVPIKVRGSKENATFSRRNLASSLQDHGLGFKEAHAVARQVEQNVRTEGLEVVSRRELAHFVALALESRFGRDLRLKYEAAVEQPTDLQIIDEVGARFPFSRGILAQSLTAIGLNPELSHQLAKKVEDVLWRLGKREFSRDTVRKVVAGLLNQEAGEEFARRYELMRSVRRPDRPIIILIGGAPGVGKSTIASEISYRLGISRIVSSDSIREALRSLISSELSPALHASSYRAWRAELLPGEASGARPQRKRVIRGFQRQVQQLSTALTAIVHRNIQEAVSSVMEGIHLVPGFIREGFKEATLVELVLSLPESDVHRNRFGARDAQTGQRRNTQNYLEHFDEIRMIQEYIESRARQEGVPVLDASDFDQAVDTAIEHVLNAVLVEHTDEMPAVTGATAVAPARPT